MADHYFSHPCDHHHHRHFLNKRPSWVCTLATQVLLCLALYAALSIGKPQTTKGIIHNERRVRRQATDLYFLSVRGGFRPQKLEAQLLQQMTKAMKIYKAKFVVNISDLGDDDPLTQNATLHFPFLKVPWYTTTSSQGDVKGNFLKRISIPYGQVLDIIAVDTGSLQLNETRSNHLRWLQRTLEMSASNWHVVIGFDSLIFCEEENAKKSVKFYEPLHDIFIKYGVSAYLSQQSCVGSHYLHEGFAFIGHQGPSDQEHRTPSLLGNPGVTSEMTNGFIIHRVSPLEIESYFIGPTGKVVFKSLFHQHGRGTM